MDPSPERPAPRVPAGPSGTSGPPAHRRSDGRFCNPWPGDLRHGFLQFLRWSFSWRKLQGLFERLDPSLFPVARPAPMRARAAEGELRVTWLGHASVLVQLGPVNLLTDPIWSRRASPVSFAGPERWVPPPLALADLPPIDVVLLSHDHYDHLDRDTVRELARRQPEARWIAPLGLSDLLSRWGARSTRELDWWESGELRAGGIRVRFTCTPARHFAARGLFDRNRRLWCGWSVEAGGRRVFFAGDTGYHPEFAAIGGRLGPFDVSLLPIGAYEPRWFMRPVHMSPEEAVQAWRDLSAGKERRAGALVPVHWGTFRLTDEPMSEPPARLRRAWEDARAPGSLWMLQHGETRRLPPGSRAGAANEGPVGP
jgi:N-acyl-phosphatidylethanolamine-hydrolysing phospholipase D